jgi:hypothetical protein
MRNHEIDNAQSQLAKIITLMIELSPRRCTFQQLKYRRDKLQCSPAALDVIQTRAPIVLSHGGH